jgi:ABC-type multidrug transport system ATPase subunit
VRGVEVVARDLRAARGGRPVLDGISLVVRPGELVAIAGASGAGKTTLLEALAGVRPADSGAVAFDGVDVYRNLGAFRAVLGYVPQDDIIHVELPLERTLRYAASLRFPSSASKEKIAGAVDAALDTLHLADHRHVRVGALSGGQRKRASIAVELLIHPHVFFLDEPTSGLDPDTGYELLAFLRELSEAGSTVVFTTHAVQDISHCDRVVFLAAGGRLAFSGPPAEALSHFGVDSMEQVYARLDAAEPPDHAERSAEIGEVPAPPERQAAPELRRPAGFLRQWSVLTQRSFESIARNRLTVAILLGSPALVVAMFAILFRPGAFAFAHPSPSAIAMIVF